VNSTITPVQHTSTALRRYFRSAQHILPATAVVDPLLVDYIKEDILGQTSAVRDNELVEMAWKLLTDSEKRQAHVNLFHSSYDFPSYP
jgi:hypothetical protein